MKLEILWPGIFLGASACIDKRRMEIPVWIPAVGFFTGLLWQIGKGNLLNSLWGILPGVLFLLLSKWGKEAVGAGDGLMLIALGIWEELPLLCGQLLGAFFLAALWGILMMILRKGRLKKRYPFLPFLFLGYVGGMLL